jgi:hypothetical protein
MVASLFLEDKMKLMIDKTWEVTNKVLEKLAAID